MRYLSRILSRFSKPRNVGRGSLEKRRKRLEGRDLKEES